jgi:hypothetical protein
MTAGQVAAGWRFSRAGGGGPYPAGMRQRLTEFSPRRRGWSPVAPQRVSGVVVNSTITSGVDDLSEKLQAMRDVLPAWRRPRFGHTGRVRASRSMTSSWWVVAGL